MFPIDTVTANLVGLPINTPNIEPREKMSIIIPYFKLIYNKKTQNKSKKSTCIR